MGNILSLQHSRAEQSCRSLTEAGAALAAQLPAEGFDTSAIADAGHAFDFSKATPWPRLYAAPPWSLPDGAVRVLALPLSGALTTKTSRLTMMAQRAALAVTAALPAGATVWAQPTDTLHATLWHPGVPPGQLGRLTRPVRGENLSQLRREREIARSLVLQHGPRDLTLVAERLLMTRSGVLLLLLRPADGCTANGSHAVSRLRGAFADAFPVVGQQPGNLIHVSLLRLLQLPAQGANSAATVRRLVSTLAELNRRLYGERVTLRGVLYSVERRIMTLEGAHHQLWFA